jgi:hypothetical protein
MPTIPNACACSDCNREMRVLNHTQQDPVPSGELFGTEKIVALARKALST